MEDYERTLFRACAHFDFKWPKNLISGVMYFEGTRITINDFVQFMKERGLGPELD